MLEGKVLITGGSGFLGRGIMRRAQKENWPCSFSIYSRDEHNQALCREKYPKANYVLGDIQNKAYMKRVMHDHNIVIHAGALKFIPQGETNAFAVIDINIDGSMNVLSAVLGVPSVDLCIGISTDKAVQPVNIYGASKMVMERAWAEIACYQGHRFQTVRYGNVVGSTGSVIPIMQKSIRETGRVKVTNPNMTRFWMSIDDAVDCILEAAKPERIPGSVTVPAPKAMSLYDLAKTLLSNTIAYGNPENYIDIIGTRLGEKEHESLISSHELGRVSITNPNYYEIVPSNITAIPRNDLEVSSANPPAGWVTQEQMLEWIKDAQGV